MIKFILEDVGLWVVCGEIDALWDGPRTTGIAIGNGQVILASDGTAVEVDFDESGLSFRCLSLGSIGYEIDLEKSTIRFGDGLKWVSVCRRRDVAIVNPAEAKVTT